MQSGHLKKEFNESDITRIRNLVKGKYGEKSKSQVGFSRSKNEVKYKNGDRWVVGNTHWKMEGGVVQNIPNLNIIRKQITTPLFCPSCSNLMKGKFDNKMYKIHKKCFDCVIVYETRLKAEGTFDEYQKKLMMANAKDVLHDLNDGLDNFIDNFYDVEQIMTEIGDIEDWEGSRVDKETIKKDIINHLKEIESQILN